MNEKLTLSDNDKLNFINSFSTLFNAGIPIIEIVDSLLEDSKGNTQKILTILREDLIQGKRLYTSLLRFPRTFDKVTINTIRAAEEAGTLDIILKDILIQIKKDMELEDKLKGALVYPAIIMVVFFGVLILILTVAIPKIAEVFSRLDIVLPLPTRMLIAVSDLLMNHTIPTILVFGVTITIIILIFRSRKQVILNLVFQLPIISQLIKEIDLTRFCRSVHLLLNSGVAITNTLDLAKEVVIRQDIKIAINHTREIVLSGGNLTDGFKENKSLFSSIMIKTIEAGEKTGTLDKSMQDMAEYLDYQVSNTIKTLTILIEPFMIVVIGGFIGGMMLSILGPIYGIIGQIGGR